MSQTAECALFQVAALAKLILESRDTFAEDCDCRSRRCSESQTYGEFERLDSAFLAMLENLADPHHTPDAVRVAAQAAQLRSQLTDLLSRHHITLQADAETDRAIGSARYALEEIVRRERDERSTAGRGVAVDFSPASEVLAAARRLQSEGKHQQARDTARKLHSAIEKCRGRHRYTVNRQQVETLVTEHTGVDFSEALTQLERAARMLEANDVMGAGNVARGAARLARRKVAPPKPRDPRSLRVFVQIDTPDQQFGGGQADDTDRLAGQIISRMGDALPRTEQ